MDYGQCAWCAAPATGTKLVEYPEVKKDGGLPTVIHSDRRVPACASHIQTPQADDPQAVRQRQAAQERVNKRAWEPLF